MYRIKLHKTSNRLWPIYIGMFTVKWMFFFFYFLLNHFPKTHRNFWDVYDVNLQEKKFGRSAAYSCRTNFFILFYNFKGKKTPTQVFSCGICETFKNSGGCFWKQVTCYYVIKNYAGHKLAIFNVFLLLYCIYC